MGASSHGKCLVVQEMGSLVFEMGTWVHAYFGRWCLCFLLAGSPGCKKENDRLSGLTGLAVNFLGPFPFFSTTLLLVCLIR